MNEFLLRLSRFIALSIIAFEKNNLMTWKMNKNRYPVLLQSFANTEMIYILNYHFWNSESAIYIDVIV